MPAHLKQHAINDADDHAPGTNGTLLGTEAAAVVEKAFGPSASASVIVQRDASAQIDLPLVPTDPEHAASKSYVDQQIATGRTWKELVLECNQFLDGASGGVRQAILIALAANLASGDTIVITDGTTTETFTAVGAAPAAFEFIAGGSAAITTTNLVAAINADSTLWDAVETDGLDAYLSGGADPQIVIYRTAIPGGAADDRVHGTIAGGQADVRVVEFATGKQDYRESSGTESDLPGADPTAKRFGFGRAAASIETGDTHRCANNNEADAWDGDDEVWQNTDTGTTVLEGDGIDVTGAKVSTDVATATVEQKYGGLVNTRTADGSAGAAADAGYNAVQTDDTDLAINSSNELALKSGSKLDKLRGAGSWTSSSGGDKEPTLAECNTLLGTTPGDIGNWGFLVEDGTAVASNSTFLVYKKANAGADADYHLVELSEL